MRVRNPSASTKAEDHEHTAAEPKEPDLGERAQLVAVIRLVGKRI